jgi:hypothetical protein
MRIFLVLLIPTLDGYSSGVRTLKSEIEGAFGLFNGLAFNGMGINHCGSYIAVPQQLLNRADVIVPLEKMAGKTVAKGMGRGTFRDCCFTHRLFDSSLHMRFMQVIPPVFPGRLHVGHLFGREEPLPDEILGGVLVLLVQGIHQENPVIVSCQVPLMQVLHEFKLLSQLRNDRLGKRHGSVFLPFPVMNGQDQGIKIEAMHTKIQALEKRPLHNLPNIVKTDRMTESINTFLRFSFRMS